MNWLLPIALLVFAYTAGIAAANSITWLNVFASCVSGLLLSFTAIRARP